MDLTQITSQLKLKTQINTSDGEFGTKNINGITGIVDNSVSSLKALIFANKNPEYDEKDPTNFDVTGMTSNYDNNAFIFDLKKDYKFNLSSEITDHYVESNVAIQDHIGLKPIILEVSGIIGEITLSEVINKEKNANMIASSIGKNVEKVQENKNLFNSVDSYLSRMGSLTSFAPNLANQSLNVYNTAKYVYGTTNQFINFNKQDKTISSYGYTEGYDLDTIKKTKQFYFIDWFRIQWWNRASFTIVTPYGVLKNMYIMDLSAVQPGNTRYVTNLNIKFKQIRKAIVINEENKSAQERDTQLNKITDNEGELVLDIESVKENVAWYGDNLNSDTLNNQSVTIANETYDVGKSHNTATVSYNVKEKTRSAGGWRSVLNKLFGGEE